MTQWRHAANAALIPLFVILFGHSAWAEIGQIKNVTGQVFLSRITYNSPPRLGT